MASDSDAGTCKAGHTGSDRPPHPTGQSLCHGGKPNTPRGNRLARNHASPVPTPPIPCLASSSCLALPSVDTRNKQTTEKETQRREGRKQPAPTKNHSKEDNEKERKQEQEKTHTEPRHETTHTDHQKTKNQKEGKRSTPRRLKRPPSLNRVCNLSRQTQSRTRADKNCLRIPTNNQITVANQP